MSSFQIWCLLQISKYLGRGHVYHDVASPLLFQNSLKTSGHRGYVFLEFWCWNLVPFLPDIGFQLLKSSWSSLTYFSFNDVSNVLYRLKIWTAGRPIQHPDWSHAAVIAAVCGFALSCWNTLNIHSHLQWNLVFLWPLTQQELAEAANEHAGLSSILFVSTLQWQPR